LTWKLTIYKIVLAMEGSPKMINKNGVFLLMMFIALIFLAACSVEEVTPTVSSGWLEEEITFTSGANELYGVLTLPTSEGPHPAIVLLSGSERGGAGNSWYQLHAHRLVKDGYAVLLYDPPGTGRSPGSHDFETLEDRAQEAVAAVEYMQSREDIQSDAVGLWGHSQGGWVTQMAAAKDDDVAFIISVSGSGVTPAEQEVYRVEAQSKAAGFSEEDVTKATIFRRLLVDWVLSEPMYREANEDAVRNLGEGSWNEMMAVVYDSESMDPAENLSQGIKILKEVDAEPWAEFLYLEQELLPLLRNITPEQIEMVVKNAGETILEDPVNFLTKVHCPVLALFGEADKLVPTTKSAALYEQYLNEAGNDDVTIVIFPGADHSINGFTPDYWDTISDWLGDLSN